jgi:hypothetical protein
LEGRRSLDSLMKPTTNVDVTTPKSGSASSGRCPRGGCKGCPRESWSTRNLSTNTNFTIIRMTVMLSMIHAMELSSFLMRRMDVT